MKENFDLSICEFIEESMWFYTYIDFCDNAIFIKKKYESLKPLEKKLYRWYVYANTHMDICFKNGILTKKVKKQVPPDTTAQIFWLKNRKKEQWREKVEVVKTDEDLQNINKNISNIANLLNNPKPNRSEKDV